MMPIDFNAWRLQFIEALIASGLPRAQAQRYLGEFEADARRYYDQKITPADAAGRELLQ